jgi:uncharacterized protein YndB with AHSA1/START domain
MSDLTGVAVHSQTSQLAASIDLTREIAASPRRVFDVFTMQFATWWPKEFRLGSSELIDVVIEPFEGGRWYELLANGSECDWGRVLVWDPPNRLVLTWQIGVGFQKEDDSSKASRLELLFDPLDSGRTLVRLTHSQLQSHGDGWESLHRSLSREGNSVQDGGWAFLMHRLATSESFADDEYGASIGAGAIRFERMLPGPIERVWSYLVDSELRGQWLASGPIPDEVGNPFVLHFRHADLSPIPEAIPEKYAEFADGCELPCTLLRFDPPHELAFSWDGSSNVVFKLRESGDRVILTLIHSEIPGDEHLSEITGWHVHLANLVDRLEGRLTKPFWAHHLRVETEYERRLP